jgi:pyruvate dehydrogenase E2 component (dihydrolipoamide acetyltransferase)
MASIITMPKLSPTMEEGTLAKWTKREGDKIAPGDVIAEVETDKANMEFPLEDEGVLLKLLVNEGDTVKLGDPVAVLGEAGEDPAEALKSIGGAKPTAAAPAKPPVAAGPVAPSPARAPAPSAPAPSAPAAKAPAPAPVPIAAAPSGNGHGRVLASPFARKLALEKGVDLRAVAGSGPRGRIVQRDIEQAARAGIAGWEARPAVPGEQGPSLLDQLVPASQMRKTIARRLVEAKRDIPHIYLTSEATVDRLLELREEINQVAEGPVRVSVNDLVVKALALALTRVPDANVSWTTEGLLRHGGVHVGIAVSLPDNGLITPVVRDADRMSIGTLAKKTRELAERARAKKLQPPEYSGGSATVSNLGMFGVREFVAIINPPESVILAVGATEKRAVVIEAKDKDGQDTIEIRRRMTLTLSCDHRVVDGVLGAKLLGEVVKLLENPVGMLL